jgi:hypothetical protein
LLRPGWAHSGLVAALVLCAGAASGADNIGDVSVSAAAIYTGPTFHGYAEARVVLENNSSKTHNVTLTSPNRSFTSGNSISRITRTVTLTPGVEQVVSLLQPPLPGNGDSQIRVSVDGRDEGVTRLPNANQHCAYRGYGSAMTATAFLSRNVDADAVERMLNGGTGDNDAYTADKATGPPDAFGAAPANVWMPDARVFGKTNWLELVYTPPIAATQLSIYNSQSPTSTGFIELVGASGTVVDRLDLGTGRASVSTRSRSGGGMRWVQTFTFATTSEPVKTVRLNFGVTPPSAIAIDAVELTGTGGGHYATAARASSDNHAAGPVRPSAVRVGTAPGRSLGDPNAVQCLRAETALADWSDNWLAYTPFDVVVLAAVDLPALPGPVAAALGDYLQAGGNIMVVGAGSMPAAWNASQTTNLSEMTVFEAGFGRGYELANADLSRLNSQTVRDIHQMVLSAAQYWSSLPNDTDSANSKMPVVENQIIPVRGITVIMLLFIIVVGPLNIFLLARKDKRIWMLWTIPAISLVTALLVFAYSLLAEGITPNTRIAGLTVLHQAGHHAATYGAEGFYCPLTPNGGLRFENLTEATPLVSQGYTGSGSPREVDWSQTQHFLRGWVTARVSAQFHLRKSEGRRERIEWHKVNGGWEILNGLGAPIKSLWLADQDMHFYQAADVPAGQPAVLKAVSNPPPAQKLGPRGLLGSLGYAPSPPGDESLNYLQPGTYLAVLEGNPFVENALGAAASAKRTRSSAVVYGILDPPATP